MIQPKGNAIDAKHRNNYSGGLNYPGRWDCKTRLFPTLWKILQISTHKMHVAHNVSLFRPKSTPIFPILPPFPEMR